MIDDFKFPPGSNLHLRVRNGYNVDVEHQGEEVEVDEAGADFDQDKSVSVQFSPVEFLQATNRLAHLNLEGFERFVGNTIDRALAGARAKSSDVLGRVDNLFFRLESWS